MKRFKQYIKEDPDSAFVNKATGKYTIPWNDGDAYTFGYWEKKLMVRPSERGNGFHGHMSQNILQRAITDDEGTGKAVNTIEILKKFIKGYNRNTDKGKKRWKHEFGQLKLALEDLEDKSKEYAGDVDSIDNALRDIHDYAQGAIFTLGRYILSITG